ncbi:MAG: Chromosome partition protein Smc [Verrucomicrobiae bacterium]|nr:Chromosome partition protein Smc [Verrucomicrobiae bacterium]
MYLKSLQLIGFKSFAEKTTLEFLPGVAAIVGPNGCGKSNVSDAIRWVLGEQSAKALRGSEMADVIFNGTDGRKAIGMAEVSLTFADVDPKLISLPGVNLDFTEITVTRRVYRDGTGEYLLNKTACRLRDIQQMFMDTGIGRSSYSMMAQGQIDQILSAHPEDRRTIFEEAAGINKYKHQKKEALRKLEYTEQNLMRLTDIIKEVKRQIISLQRQAGKARRYKEIFDQLKTLDTRLQRHRYDLLHAEIADLDAQIIAIAAQSEQFASAIGDRETQIAELRRSLHEIESAINAAVSHDHELRNDADRHQQRIGYNTERIAESEKRIDDDRLEIAASQEKIHVQEQLLASLNAEFEQIDSLLAAEQAKVQAQQDALKAHDNELGAKRAALTAANTGLITLESQSAQNRNELGALDHKKKHDLFRAEKLSAEKINLEDQRRTLQERLDAFSGSLTDLRRSVESSSDLLNHRQADLDQLTEQLRSATREHQASVAELSKKTARLELLRQMFAAPDGRTTLGNILDVQPEFGAAIEAALQHNLRTILADDLDAARTLLAGKHPVAAPDSRRNDSPVASGGALEHVRIRDERFAPLLNSLLANVAIADDLDAALALWKPGLAIATRQGQFIDSHGILSAVSNSHIGEIATLAEEAGKLQTRTTELATRQSELEDSRLAHEQQVNRLREELHANEVTLASREGELSALTTERRDLESKVHTVIFELTAIEQQDTEEKQRRAELLAALEQAAERERGLRDELAGLQQTVTDLTNHRDGMIAQLTELRVAVGGVQHKRAAIQGQREPIAGRIRDLQDRITACTNEMDSHANRIELCRVETTESEQKIIELAAAREQSQQQLAGLQHQRTEVATGIEHTETELRNLRTLASAAQSQKSGLDVALAQKRMEIQNLKDRVWQKYQLNVEDIRSDSITVTVADGGPVISEQVPLPTDWDAIELQVAELQSKLDAMGPVNVEAIQEYDELEERYKFLSQQHEDLVKAKEQLLQVIAKINTTTKELFSETFTKIRENFQTMYTELFGGGKANLILTDENDPLESGIEIVAKPPGKQLQSITLLSGGEKTMTATALLFAIYMVKPSPFCVLDELDAPLDESNINRFIRILTRFIHQSQFVVITHNKRTIGMADALYGITMEEHGVSKVVSVKFSPREEKARKAAEKARETQEDRIDGAAAVRPDLRPHEEELHNDLLVAKESTVAAIPDAPPVVAENAPTLSSAAAPIADEVKAAVAAVQAVNESVKETLTPETTPQTPVAS